MDEIRAVPDAVFVCQANRILDIVYSGWLSNLIEVVIAPGLHANGERDLGNGGNDLEGFFITQARLDVFNENLDVSILNFF